jgi:hypothetical protein
LGLAAVAACCLGIGCSSDGRVSGVISETTNGATVAGIVRDQTGSAYAGLAVHLRPGSYLADGGGDQHVDTVITDSSGAYRFENVIPGMYVVEAAPSAGLALAATVLIHQGDSAATIDSSSVKPTITLSNIITAAGQTGPFTVQVMGTPITTLSDADGDFVLENVPDAELLIHCKAVGQTGVASGVFPRRAVLWSPALQLDTARNVVLENFDDGDTRHLLYPLREMGEWYTMFAPSAVLAPAGIDADLSLGMGYEGAWRGKSLQVNLTYTDSTEISKALCVFGCEFGRGATGSPENTRWYDLSAMQEVVFMAKGSGELHVTLITRRVREQYDGASNFEHSVTLTPEWTEYRIPATDFAPPAESQAALDGVIWSDVSKDVAEITFYVDKDAQVGLDEIRFTGLDPVEFLEGGL